MLRVRLRHCPAPADPPEAPKLPAKAAISSAMNVFFMTRRNMRYSLSCSTTSPTLDTAPVTGGKRLCAKTETISPPL